MGRPTMEEFRKMSRDEQINVMLKEEGEVVKRYRHHAAMEAVSQALGKKWENKSRPFGDYSLAVARKAADRADSIKSVPKNTGYVFKGWEFIELEITGIGNQMENTAGMLKQVNEEINVSKEIIQNLHNEISAAYDPVMIRLGEVIEKIRDRRMSVVRELNQSLKAMKDVRSFFLDKDYQVEMDRLERFVVLCERFRQLSNDGTLDAIVDASLKLAVEGDTDETEGQSIQTSTED